MPVIISLLRGINVGGHNKIKMEALRALCESLGLRGAQTYIQSGNVVFRTREQNLVRLRKKIQDAIEREFRFRPGLVLRTASQWKEVIAANPFARRTGLNPGKLVVIFLADQPGRDAARNLRQFDAVQEELKLMGSELFMYCPKGAGQAEFPWNAVDKILGTPGTARNWNTVTKLLDMAESLEAGA
jgi:uncharacterized protein (DUF1697 family)